MAIVATLVGIMLLAAAAHYCITTYNNSQETQEYHQPYKPPEEYWIPPQQEENSLPMLPESTYTSTVKFTTHENDLLSDPKSVYEIKSTTIETSSQDTTPPYSTDTPQSTSMGQGNEIEYAIGPPRDMNIRTLHLSKKYYNYKINSDTKFDAPTSQVEFVGVDHPAARDRIKIPDKEKPDKETTDFSIPSTSKASILGHAFLMIVIMVMVLLP